MGYRTSRRDTRAALKKQFSTEIVTRVQWLFDRFPFSFSLARLLDRIGTAGIVFLTERERETRERVGENGAGSAGHYLLLTIFMRLSIAEISTRCDDIDWHAVKPSDMRLRRSPPTPTRPSRARVVSFLALSSSYIVNVRRFIYTRYPKPVLKSHAPSISISPHPRRDCPPCRAESASELPKIGFASIYSSDASAGMISPD